MRSSPTFFNLRPALARADAQTSEAHVLGQLADDFGDPLVSRDYLASAGAALLARQRNRLAA